MHRDVAEASATGLISVSLGCDAVFVIGTGEGSVVFRLRSGSAVYMAGESRFAWHGVPRIVEGSCPGYLAGWPGGEGEGEGEGEAGVGAESEARDAAGEGEADVDALRFPAWKNWMSHKRINLNVRQMSD